MADETNNSFPSARQEEGGRGPRPSGNRDAGGFRIRLSDNEMQAARALQEALGLRSTVAVLGFSLRTLAQQLEAGQLDEIVAQHRAQGGGRPPAPRGPAGGGDRRRERGDAPRGGASGGGRGPRVDPFARPSRPVAAAPEIAEVAEVAESASDAETSFDAEAAFDAEAGNVAETGSVAETSGDAETSGVAETAIESPSEPTESLEAGSSSEAAEA